VSDSRARAFEAWRQVVYHLVTQWEANAQLEDALEKDISISDFEDLAVCLAPEAALSLTEEDFQSWLDGFHPDHPLSNTSDS
jgi:hypothetical protein